MSFSLVLAKFPALYSQVTNRIILNGFIIMMITIAVIIIIMLVMITANVIVVVAMLCWISLPSFRREDHTWNLDNVEHDHLLDDRKWIFSLECFSSPTNNFVADFDGWMDFAVGFDRYQISKKVMSGLPPTDRTPIVSIYFSITMVSVFLPWAFQTF